MHQQRDLTRRRRLAGQMSGCANCFAFLQSPAMLPSYASSLSQTLRPDRGLALPAPRIHPHVTLGNPALHHQLLRGAADRRGQSGRRLFPQAGSSGLLGQPGRRDVRYD